jgi:hypothetical protein
MTRPAAIATALLCGVLACTDPETGRREGLRTICEVQSRCGAACESDDGAEQSRLLNVYIRDHAAINAQRDYQDLMLHAAPDERGERLRRLAREAGVDACPFADLLDESAGRMQAHPSSAAVPHDGDDDATRAPP